MVLDAPCRVVTSPTLLRLITSYQRGVPLGLFHFWCAHAENRKIPLTDRHSLFAKRLDQLPVFVAEHGDWQLLKLLPFITVSFPPRRWSRVCREAAKKNDEMMLQWAMDHGYLYVSDALRVIVSLGGGNPQALSMMEGQQAMLARIAPQSLYTGRLYAELKNAAVIQWLQAHVPQLQWRWDRVVDAAVTHGRLEVLRYAYACHRTTRWLATRLVNQPRPPTAEYTACIRFLLHRHAQQMTGGELALIVFRPSVELLELVNGAESAWVFVNEAVRMAVDANNLEVLHRFESIGLISTDKPVDISQSRMNDTMLYLLEHRLAIVTGAAMDRAAVSHRWDIVRYIHDQCSVQCTTVTMDEAAKQGRMDQVVFLHERRTEGCSSKALDHAALHDNLTLVRYLSEVVRAPGSTDAMDIAAANGHLEVVKYLHSHRSEGCTSGAVRKALENGHSAVVQYLYVHYRHVFDNGLLEPLLRCGHFEIWQTLRGVYPEEAEASIPAAMTRAIQMYELQTVRYIVHTLGQGGLITPRLVHVAEFSQALSWGLTWATAVWRVTGPQCCTMATVRSMIDMDYVSTRVVQFVVDSCVEPNAREQALQYARDTGKAWFIQKLQQEWTPMPAHSIKLHPWLLDPRTPSWVIRRLCGDMRGTQRGYLYSGVTSYTWAVQAAYRRDCTVLAMVLEASKSEATAADPELSFVGARAAAVRIGHLPTLQWLLKHVGTPVEPLLLDEALFYHRYEVALWLASHCPEACTTFQPRPEARFYHDCGYDWSLRQWLESEEGEPVRSLLDVDSLPWESKA